MLCAAAVVLIGVVAVGVLVRTTPSTGGDAPPASAALPAFPPAIRVQVAGLRNDPAAEPVLGFSPMVLGEVVAVLGDFELIGYGLADGRERWRAPCDDAREPVQASHTDVYFALECGRGTTIFDPSDGHVVAVIPSSTDGSFARGAEVTMTAYGVRARSISALASDDSRLAPPATGPGEATWRIRIVGERILGVDAQNLYWSGPSEELIAYRLVDGTEAWRSGISTRRVVVGSWGVLAVTSRDEIARVDPTNGAKLVSVRIDSRLVDPRPVAVVDDVMIVVDRAQGLYGLDATSGAVRWVMPVEDSRHVVVAGRHAVVEDKGRLSVVSAVNGTTLATTEDATSLAAAGPGHAAWIEGENTLVIQPLA